MTVGRCLFFCLDTKEPNLPENQINDEAGGPAKMQKNMRWQARNQNWFLGNNSAALRNVRFFLKVVLEGLEHVVHNSLVLGWFMVCWGSLFLKTVGQVYVVLEFY